MGDAAEQAPAAAAAASLPPADTTKSELDAVLAHHEKILNGQKNEVETIVNGQKKEIENILATHEAVRARHRKEIRDLQSRVTQKKKNATKKTRKKVNDECLEMERQLTEKQKAEMASLDLQCEGGAEPEPVSESEEEQPPPSPEKGKTHDVDAVTAKLQETTLDSIPPQQQTAGAPGKKRNRQKERLARRQAEIEAASAKAQEEASKMTDHRAVERVYVDGVMKREGLVEHEILADGHCLFSAIADQLHHRGVTEETLDYKEIRKQAADYMEKNPEDFEPFLEPDQKPWETYLRNIRHTTTWGGQMEMQALVKVYGVAIRVVQTPKDEIIGELGEGVKVLWVVFYKSSMGMHYNSLRTRDS
ncbi:hypothetical protein QBC36DRAFT_21858 [Triangularia setosa]|uniref:OTU domain-containing protein n=1 Tax=Triangularia setosa TaxID=2587417 RepID=A0AAN6W760_9PEZI|nr:hypothetical protein QBC36DRAFT_21858 [Podospora setosa]